MHASSCNRLSLAEPRYVAGDIRGGDVKGGNGAKFAELEKYRKVGAVVLEGAQSDG